jgi:hypothetical protein
MCHVNHRQHPTCLTLGGCKKSLRWLIYPTVAATSRSFIMMRCDIVTVTWHCDAISLCHVTIDNVAQSRDACKLLRPSFGHPASQFAFGACSMKAEKTTSKAKIETLIFQSIVACSCAIPNLGYFWRPCTLQCTKNMRPVLTTFVTIWTKDWENSNWNPPSNDQFCESKEWPMLEKKCWVQPEVRKWT